jgi:hypothetical protein
MAQSGYLMLVVCRNDDEWREDAGRQNNLRHESASAPRERYMLGANSAYTRCPTSPRLNVLESGVSWLIRGFKYRTDRLLLHQMDRSSFKSK